MYTRIYTDQTLQEQTTVELNSSASTHLLKVLRSPVGSTVVLFNGDGNNYISTLLSGTKRAILNVENRSAGIPRSPNRITLFQGISRGDRMDFSVQKATELGVSTIQPVLCEKGKVKIDGDRLEKKKRHWEAIAVSACEQCGRSDIPKILPTRALTQLLEPQALQTSLVLTFGDHPSLAERALAAAGDISVLVGPESGLSEREIGLSISSGWLPCVLGPRILRTETATITALAILQHVHGDLSTYS